MELSEFEALLGCLLLPDNEKRNQAEKVYEKLKQDKLEEITILLLKVCTITTTEQLRSIAAILLRSLFARSEERLWYKCSNSTKEIIKEGILQRIEKETSNYVRGRLGDVLVVLIVNIQGSGSSWPQAFQFLATLSQSNVVELRELVFSMYNQLTSYIGLPFKPYYPTLSQLTKMGLTDPQSIKVRVNALNANSNAVTFCKQKSEYDLFSPSLKLMLDVLVQCLNNSDESNSLSCLQSFIEIEFMSSAFLKPVTSDLILLCIQIASQANIISSVRQASVELLVTISESRPSIINKNRDVVRKLVEILLNMLLESSDDDDLLKWTKKEEDSRDYVSMAEEYLDRVSFALGGETLLPVIIEYASVLLKNENWKNRRTGLLAISQIGEGCTQSMKPILSQILR
eukprot:TRINITY_DN3423_c0_g1_i4.p1 TRINITY_DN3423_c0_g1~~TRINITY_DN3423_c0_g1_i4.p1  ORF type:complete len:400 (-),score=51.70 TRINITY_DN3423_c0_g1_i4:207-1406(-)